jgi:flagellar biosynthesis protein FlhF
MLPPAEPLQLDGQGIPKIMILVGPTGVGKTTTVAKLAAHFRLREGKRVGLITTDTYRIAAVDQLKAYADIMDLPLEVVFTPEELPASITRLCDCDLILIDTSGRNHRDVERMNELRAYLKAARLTLGGNMKKVRRKEGVTVSERRKRGRRRASETGVLKAENQHIEVHLLLSCTCHQDQLVQVAQNFGEVGVDKVVFTKLDEAVGFGVVLNVASRLKYRLSYLTTGQDVPDDIEPGHRRKIAEMLLKNGADRMILRQQPVEGCRGESVDRLA